MVKAGRRGGGGSVLSHLKVLPRHPKAPTERSLACTIHTKALKHTYTHTHTRATAADVNSPASRARHLHTPPLEGR